MRLACLAVSLLALCACAGPTSAPSDPRAREQRPLVGEALARRTRDLVTARETLAEMQTTLRDLQRRRDRAALPPFADFVRAYFGLQLDRLLAPEWPSRHPDLMALDATLRLAKADLLRRLDDAAKAGRVLDDIERRFLGRQEMLIEYPMDHERTVRDALKVLRSRSWWTL